MATALSVQNVIAEVKGARLLQGFRGRPAADLEALEDCMVIAPDMGDAGGHSDRGWVLSTVGISDPPASRSNTRTVDWALARIQSGVLTKRDVYLGAQ